MKPTLIILAAGMGSRYGGLKQLDGFGPNKEAIIDYSIHDAIKAGFKKIVFIVRSSFIEEFRSIFTPKLKGKVEVVYVTQELDALPVGIQLNPKREKPWGTAHAVLVAKEAVQDPFAVINADDYYGPEAYTTLINYFNKATDNADYAVVSYYLKNTLSDYGTVNRGVCQRDDEHYLVDIVEAIAIEKIEGAKGRYTNAEQKEIILDADTLVSMNMFGFFPDFFEKTEEYFIDFLKESGDELKSEFFIPKVLDQMIESGFKKVKVLESPSSWFGVTYQEDKPFVVKKIKQLIADGVYNENLWG